MSSKLTSNSLLASLADFRFQLRQFLLASEAAAHQEDLQPQQHQLLLQIAGWQHASAITIAHAAERLGLRHNSTVELVDRSAAEGWIERTQDPADRRRVVLTITPRGRRMLERLSGVHAQELRERAPALIAALSAIAQSPVASGKLIGLTREGGRN